MLKESPHQLNFSVSQRAAWESESPEETPFFHLEITRGQTRFPLRPVRKERFLIGAGSHCHLRLGGPNVPILHSQICIADAVYWEQIADAPPLRINGKHIHWAKLQEGDEIEIDGFRFVVRSINLQLLQPVSPLNSSIPDSLEQSSPEVSELSASELVEQIEREDASVEEFESRRRMGAEALIQAAAHRALARREALPPHWTSSQETGNPYDQVTPEAAEQSVSKDISNRSGEPELLNEMDHVLNQLNGFKKKLANQAQREVPYADAIEVLLDVQQKIAGQLEKLLNQQNESVPPTVPAEKTQESRQVA